MESGLSSGRLPAWARYFAVRSRNGQHMNALGGRELPRHALGKAAQARIFPIAEGRRAGEHKPLIMLAEAPVNRMASPGLWAACAGWPRATRKPPKATERRRSTAAGSRSIQGAAQGGRPTLINHHVGYAILGGKTSWNKRLNTCSLSVASRRSEQRRRRSQS